MFKGFDKSSVPQTTEEIMRHFDRDIDRETEEWICSQFTPYIFVDDKNKPNAGCCSHCRRKVWLPFPYRHNDKAVCPECKVQATVKHTWRGVNSVAQQGIFYCYKKSKLNPQYIVCEMYYAYTAPMNTKSAELCAKTIIVTDSLTLFVYGCGGIQIVQDWYGDGDCFAYFGQYWYKKDGAPSPRRNFSASGLNVYINRGGIKQAVQGTPFAWSAWEQYLSYERYLGWKQRASNLIRYFDIFSKYEATEYLAKTGLFWPLSKYMTGGAIYGIFNWHGKTPNEILRIRTTKEDRTCLKEFGQWLTGEHLRIWIHTLRFGKISLKDVTHILKDTPILPKVLFRHITIKKAVAYLKKQRQKYGDRGQRITIGDYDDYIKECLALNMDMTDKSVLFPADLMKSHENLSRQIVMREKKAQNDKYQKRRKMLVKKYAFTADGITVIVPQNIGDLIIEGKMQHNCVGTYIDRVTDGRTDVVFVRRIDDIDESYITMEINHNKIIQARMNYNRQPDEQGAAFVQKFKSEVLDKLIAVEAEKRKTYQFGEGR